MLNNYHSNSQSVQMNAVSGTIIKSHPKSQIRYCHLDSQLAGDLFGRNPSHVVLQAMLCGEKRVLVEIVSAKDFEEVT